MLHSNVAACELKSGRWREAADAASSAVDALNEVAKEELDVSTLDVGEIPIKTDDEEDVEEIPRPDITPPPKPSSSPSTTTTATTTNTTDQKPPSLPNDSPDLRPLRVKVLLRRAAALFELDSWQDLAASQSDYSLLLRLPASYTLGPSDRTLIRNRLAALSPRIDAAREREMGEMWGKLKSLGNGILKPFGLSTDNFNMIKDEKTGGYSMSFNQ